ncbi:unnamed protein product [Prorocentrum cordatum]|uniref:Uncharacterized protein n=1 Tax=Prorocentrum cordatum TaxID=2364126 RepID=A0ABN9TW94_9DINO|nr:unnamed protein product [Polarella glacialis]
MPVPGGASGGDAGSGLLLHWGRSAPASCSSPSAFSPRLLVLLLLLLLLQTSPPPPSPPVVSSVLRPPPPPPAAVSPAEGRIGPTADPRPVPQPCSRSRGRPTDRTAPGANCAGSRGAGAPRVPGSLASSRRNSGAGRRGRGRLRRGGCSPPSKSERDFDLGSVASEDDDSELPAEVPRLLERMNRASEEVNCFETLAAEARARYRRRVLRFERLYARMRGEHGVAFDSAKPLFREAAPRRVDHGGPAAEELAACFRALQRHHAGLAREQELIDRLTRRGRAAKGAYLASMRQLEAISEREHARRRGALGAAADVVA